MSSSKCVKSRERLFMTASLVKSLCSRSSLVSLSQDTIHHMLVKDSNFQLWLYSKLFKAIYVECEWIGSES